MMNQEDIFKKIGQIVNELSDQYQYLAQNPQELNELELELFLANANFLSDHVQIIRKLNNGAAQKILPEHTESDLQPVVQQSVILPVTEIDPPAAEKPAPEVLHIKPVLEEEIFKLDSEPSTFEFILNEKTSDKFEFEEKSIDEIFDRPLSKEEELIIAQKQKLREKDSLSAELPEEDEIGPEPFLVAESVQKETENHPEEEKVTVPFTQYKAPETFTPIAEPVVQQEEPVIQKIEPVIERPEPVVQKEEPVIQKIEPIVQKIEPVIQKTEPVIHKEQPVSQEDLFVPSKPAAETQPKLTLNDILSGNSSHQTRSNPIENSWTAVKDLKQAISLNDKLRYIRDLFNGYNLAYAEAIDLLNKMPDFTTADTFLQNNYAVKHNWAEKQETADQFYELLHQRFPENKG